MLSVAEADVSVALSSLDFAAVSSIAESSFCPVSWTSVTESEAAAEAAREASLNGMLTQQPLKANIRAIAIIDTGKTISIEKLFDIMINSKN